MPVANKKVEIRGSILTAIFTSLTFMATTGMAIIASELCLPIALAISFITMVASLGGSLLFVSKIIHKINMKEFQKQYPDFDINVDVKEVEKELEKYKELSKVSKNIEEKKEEHLTNLPDEVREMSTKEKLAYLEQEKEFWEQVAIQEKYTNLDKQKEAIQKSLSK